jgi:hypothetical protein
LSRQKMPLLVLTPQDLCRFWGKWWLPFGKHTKNYGKAPIFWWVDHVDQLFRLGHFPSQTVDITRGCGIQWMEWGITRHHLLGWSAPVFRTPIRWFMKKLIDKQQHLKFRWIWWVCAQQDLYRRENAAYRGRFLMKSCSQCFAIGFVCIREKSRTMGWIPYAPWCWYIYLYIYLIFFTQLWCGKYTSTMGCIC